MDRIALDLTRAAARFIRIAGQVEESRYSTIAWRVLGELEQDGPARISVLAVKQRVAQPTMTSLVQRLEGEGWVTRAADPQDGRATLVGVTPEGRAALERFRRLAAARITPRLAELTDFDRATLARAAELMDRLSDGS